MGLKPSPQQSLLQIQNDFCPQVKAVNLGYSYAHECKIILIYLLPLSLVLFRWEMSKMLAVK